MTVDDRIAEIADEFADLDPRERLDLLLDFASGLPPLPPEYEARKQAGEQRVVECMTPVFLYVEVADGRVRIHADVAEEGQTVKGFVGILVEAFSGASPDEVLAVDSNLLARLGLQEAIGMNRTRGLNAVIGRIRAAVGG